MGIVDPGQPLRASGATRGEIGLWGGMIEGLGAPRVMAQVAVKLR
jgi:hypothetical protein